MQRERDARGDCKARVAEIEVLPVAPFFRDEKRGRDDDQGERETPGSDDERVGIREPDEWAGERDAEKTEAENPGRADTI